MTCHKAAFKAFVSVLINVFFWLRGMIKSFVTQDTLYLLIQGQSQKEFGVGTCKYIFFAMGNYGFEVLSFVICFNLNLNLDVL